jgi:hypothetical protein
MSLPYVYNDAGRKQNKSNERNDCTVRALSISTKTNYCVAHNFLKERGRKSRKGFLFPKKRSNDYALEYEFIWMPFPFVKGQSRMSPDRFAVEFSKGVYICKMAKHVYAAIEGVVNDVYKIGWYDGRCVYGCWRVIKLEGD